MEYTHSDIESYTVGGSSEDHTYALYDKIDDQESHNDDIHNHHHKTQDVESLNKTIYGGGGGWGGREEGGRLAALGVPIIISVRRNPIVQENPTYAHTERCNESSGVITDEMYDKITSNMVQLIEQRSRPRTMKIRLSLKIAPKKPKTQRKRRG
jgi:hypothetical protein